MTTITLEVPNELAQKLQRIKPNTLIEILNKILDLLTLKQPEPELSPISDRLPVEAYTNLLALEQLDDQALWQTAQAIVPLAQQRQIKQLLEKNCQTQLTGAEQLKLEKLQLLADQVMLRKGYAYVLLKRRGHTLPTLAELQAQV